MARSRVAKLMAYVLGELTDALAVEGFSVSGPLDERGTSEEGARSPSGRSAWFVSPELGIPGATTAAVHALINTDRESGNVRFTGTAYVVSEAVDSVLRDFPVASLDSRFKPERSSPTANILDIAGFGDLETPPKPDRRFWMVTADYGDGIERFMNDVRGPVRQWFVQRGSLGKLISLAAQPAADPPHPMPSRLRGVVVLCVLDGRADVAAEIMDFYVRRQAYQRLDSRERAVAFDQALRERFREYALARVSQHP